MRRRPSTPFLLLVLRRWDHCIYFVCLSYFVMWITAYKQICEGLPDAVSLIQFGLFDAIIHGTHHNCLLVKGRRSLPRGARFSTTS
jgi:hypothetical protein